ncbi:MAG: chorismate mutase [Solirubrobacterales bacterium]
MPDSEDSPLISTVAVRGAVQVEENTAEAIGKASRELMLALMENNSIGPGEMISVLFTATPDLDADFPATAARAAGLSEVPLICAQEIPVPGKMERVIRVMVHFKAPEGHSPQPTYLGRTEELRDDLPSAS